MSYKLIEIDMKNCTYYFSDGMINKKTLIQIKLR